MERVAADLSEGTAGAGFETTVVAFSRGSGMPFEEDKAGVRVIRAPMSAEFAKQPLSLRWIIECARQSWKADAIIIHAPNILAVIPLLLVALTGLLGIGPRVRLLFWHSDILDKGILGYLVRPLEHMMAMLSTVIVASSPPYFASSKMLKWHADKVEIVPLGIDIPGPARTPPLIPKRLEQQLRGRPFTLSVGRLVPYKGFDDLIRANAQIEEEIVSVIVGTGPEEDRLRALADEMGVSDRIVFYGSCEASDLALLFRTAVAFVLPSHRRSEAFGVVLLEALSHGLPIIACNIVGSGVPWVAKNGETSLLLPPRSPAALARAVSCMTKNRDMRAQFSAAGKADFSARFTKSKMTQSINLILTDCYSQATESRS